MGNFDAIFGGGKPGLEAYATVSYMTHNSSTVKAYIETLGVSRVLIRNYGYVLTNMEIAQAKAMVFHCKTVEEYSNMFLTTVLMQVYQVFNHSHVRYPDVLVAIDKHNPEWVDRFMQEHERKKKRCKSQVFPIDESVFLPCRKILADAL